MILDLNSKGPLIPAHLHYIHPTFQGEFTIPNPLPEGISSAIFFIRGCMYTDLAPLSSLADNTFSFVTRQRTKLYFYGFS